jgi:hypothetical protein
MGKVLQIAAHKYSIKEKDFQEDLDVDAGTDGKKSKASNDEKVFGKDKDVAQLDPFFVEADKGEIEA